MERIHAYFDKVSYAYNSCNRFSGPAQRSPMLWPARSPSRLATLYAESSDSLVASAAVSIATGWSDPVPGRELHPLKSSAFHDALFRQLVVLFTPLVGGLLPGVRLAD